MCYQTKKTKQEITPHSCCVFKGQRVSCVRPAVWFNLPARAGTCTKHRRRKQRVPHLFPMVHNNTQSLAQSFWRPRVPLDVCVDFMSTICSQWTGAAAHDDVDGWLKRPFNCLGKTEELRRISSLVDVSRTQSSFRRARGCTACIFDNRRTTAVIYKKSECGLRCSQQQPATWAMVYFC